MKDQQIATTYTGPAALIAVGLAAIAWCVARPVPFWPGILFGAVLICHGYPELRWRFKQRQIARRAKGRGGYVR